MVKKLPGGSGTYNDKVIDFTQSESFNYTWELIYDKSEENDEYNIWNLVMIVQAMAKEERVQENEQQKNTGYNNTPHPPSSQWPLSRKSWGCKSEWNNQWIIKLAHLSILLTEQGRGMRS